jgi:hypothetical protein
MFNSDRRRITRVAVTTGGVFAFPRNQKELNYMDDPRSDAAGRTAKTLDFEGKMRRVGPNFTGHFYDSDWDFPSECWASVQIVGQPCGFPG